MTPSIVPTINCEQIASGVRTWIPKHLESGPDGPDVRVFTPNQWAERGEVPEPGAVCYVQYSDQQFRNMVECAAPELDASWEGLLEGDGLWFEVLDASQGYLYRDRDQASGAAPTAPRSGTTVVDYLKLEQDLRAAKEVAEASKSPHGDAGSCNSDSVHLTIPRAKMDRVKEAAERVGLISFQRKGHTLSISAPRLAQSSDNTFQVEAMVKVLKERGWDAIVWYEVD